jgi:hypothetical protein
VLPNLPEQFAVLGLEFCFGKEIRSKRQAPVAKGWIEWFKIDSVGAADRKAGRPKVAEMGGLRIKVEPDATSKKLNTVAYSLLPIMREDRDRDFSQEPLVVRKSQETPKRGEAAAECRDPSCFHLPGVERVSVRQWAQNPKVVPAGRAKRIKHSEVSI